MCLISRPIRQTPMIIYNFYLLIKSMNLQIYILFTQKILTTKRLFISNVPLAFSGGMLVLSVCPVFPRCVLFVYHVLRWRLPSTGSKMLILYPQSLGTIPVSIHPCFMIHALEWTQILVGGHLNLTSVHSWTDRHDWF